MDDNEFFEDCVEEQLHEKVLQELKEWIKTFGKLPQNIPEVLLKRFLKVCDYDLKQTKDLLLLNYKLRSSAPNLFTKRDIMCKEIQSACELFRFFPLPKLTKDKMRITIGGFSDLDPNKFCYTECVKMALMGFDTRFCAYDDAENNEIADGEIVIMDLNGLTFQHFLKVAKNFLVAKFYMHYLQEAAPIRISQVNIVNPSPVIDKIFSLLRPFIKKETLDVLEFHSRGIDKLIERVGIENLPAKYGGTSDIDLDEVHRNHVKRMENFRDFLIDDDNWRLSE